MVHRPSDSRLLTNLLNAEKEYSKHLLSLLDYSHSSLCHSQLKPPRHHQRAMPSLLWLAWNRHGETYQDADNIAVEHQIQTGSTYLGMHMPRLPQKSVPDMQTPCPILPPGPPSVHPTSMPQPNDAVLETRKARTLGDA